MKFASLFVIIMSLLSLFLVPTESRPGKIPINAIKKGAQVVGKGLRAVNIASTAHDIYSIFHKKKH